jgi:hypothetical protein
MSSHEPKDLTLARRAYEAFWSEQPQIWFDQLAHDYQMRWVRVAREVLKTALSKPKVGRPSAPDAPRQLGRDQSPIESVHQAKVILENNKHILSKPRIGRFDGVPPRLIRRIRNAKKYLSMHKE